MDDRRRRLAQRVAVELERRGLPLSSRVVEALEKTPRHLFLAEGMWPSAYDNSPLPIGWGQTISQPLIVALMTELLQPGPDQAILEIGTGSGYQAAVVSMLVSKVYSVEVIPALAAKAAERFAQLGYATILVKQGDGRMGWPEHAPFDGIIVTAAADRLPPDLSGQLKIGGRLVAPLGGSRLSQKLYLFEKTGPDTLVRTPVLDVVFVPLV